MGQHDVRVDRYIASAAPFAIPILTKLRALIHAACPDVEETMKWSRPAFDYQGMMCGMSAFKAHLSLGFWLQTAMVEGGANADVLKRLDHLSNERELPSDRAIKDVIKRAMALNAAGVKLSRAAPVTPKPVVVPAELASALKVHAAARRIFDAMSPSHRREYCEWIAEAKREETKHSRVEKAIAQLSESKSLNWKYETRPKPVSAPSKTRVSGRGKA